MSKGKELIVSHPARPGVMADKGEAASVAEPVKASKAGRDFNPLPTLAESGIFADLNKDFGNAITAVLRAMQERDVPDGKVTVSIDIKAQVSAGNIEPAFEYKVGKSLVCKSERKGEIKPKGRFEWSEEKQDFVFAADVPLQTEMFNAEDEPESKPEAEVAESTSLVVREEGATDA
jgi:hypothetical protein